MFREKWFVDQQNPRTETTFTDILYPDEIMHQYLPSILELHTALELGLAVRYVVQTTEDILAGTEFSMFGHVQRVRCDQGVLAARSGTPQMTTKLNFVPRLRLHSGMWDKSALDMKNRVTTNVERASLRLRAVLVNVDLLHS
ncbi:hypothetical protein PROFUN_08744 [Planoprotostelium fungivorum]|uniref:Uncharacterized protein n=1 Tax=Planoprotostelium fungivorum TaxID=1890364 RepID=A0A2P6ND60_9EUKA|nr:hypothetical protein PROFUN_08744 [Planoprotostelium fungivorum]